MLSSLLLLFGILVGGTFVPCTRLGDVGLRDRWTLLLHLGLCLLLLVEEEGNGVQVGRGVFCEDGAVALTHAHGIYQHEGVVFALLVLWLAVLEVLEASLDNQSHAVFENAGALPTEEKRSVLVLDTNTVTDVLGEMLLQLGLLRF
ncbi:FACT complex protein [Pyrenophora tritici-repentis]|nr:FACT complex protein [Pyrenophora tritici-repentis]